MKYLLDTHVLIWWLNGEQVLKHQAQTILEDAASSLFISAASLWEMRIKQQKGTLSDLPEVIPQLERWRIEVVPIEALSALGAPLLKLPHSDPFDKMIFYHTMQHGLTLLTADGILINQTAYSVSTVRVR